jgi:hypothetical protein
MDTSLLVPGKTVPGPLIVTSNIGSNAGFEYYKRSRGSSSGDPGAIFTPGSTAGDNWMMGWGYETVGKLLVVLANGNSTSSSIEGSFETNISSVFGDNTSTAGLNGTTFNELGWACGLGKFCASWTRVMRSGDMTDNKINYFPRTVGTIGRSNVYAYLYDHPSGMSFAGTGTVGVDTIARKKIESSSENTNLYLNTSCKISAGEVVFNSSDYYIAVAQTAVSSTTATTNTEPHYFSETDPASELHAKATDFWKDTPGSKLHLGMNGNSPTQWTTGFESENRVVIGPGHLFRGRDIGANGFYANSAGGTRTLVYHVSLGRLRLT